MSSPLQSIRPDKIKEIFPLLTVFLIVFESLLTYWLHMSGSMNERVIIGVIMTIIFIAFLIVALQVKQIDVRHLENNFKIETKSASEVISVKDKGIEKLKTDLEKTKNELRQKKAELARLKRLEDHVRDELGKDVIEDWVRRRIL